jgi:hypothetical protein
MTIITKLTVVLITAAAMTAIALADNQPLQMELARQRAQNSTTVAAYVQNSGIRTASASQRDEVRLTPHLNAHGETFYIYTAK